LKIGERPKMEELEDKKCEFVDIIKNCWIQYSGERMSLMELRRKGYDLGYEYEGDEEDGEYVKGEGELKEEDVD
jgi:hypothetical protein